MRRRLLAAGLFVTLVAGFSLALAQTVGPFNERDAKKYANVQDTKSTWVLDFRFKDPRFIVVDVPGRGKRIICYMWYQVINNTNEPRVFIPDFELVTLDTYKSPDSKTKEPDKVTREFGQIMRRDQILPKAEEAIKRIEDPTGYLDIKNSVTIARMPIPVTKPESAPRAVTGVAIWDDVFGKLPDTTRFSIFISGLSNGWTVDDKNVVRRKTLQLNFKRLSDRNHLDGEVQFISPVEWLYRASDVKLPALDKKP